MSFTLAAAELCVTQGAVSRQIKALEEFLGFPLFLRHSQGLSLTPYGAEYARALSNSFGQIAFATDELLLAQKETSLTIQSYNAFINHWLLPKLPDFQMRYPNVKLRIVGSSTQVNFDRDDADICIRYGKGNWRGMVSNAIFSDQFVPVCSPKFLESVGGVTEAADLLSLPKFHLRQRKKDWGDWFRLAGTQMRGKGDSLMLEELAILYECVLAGHGFGILQTAYIAEDTAAGRLVAPIGPVLKRDQGYYMVVPEARAEASKVEIFRSWISEY